MKTLEELQERRTEIKARMQEIDAEAGANDLSPAATTEFEELREELLEVEPTIERIELRRKQVAELAADPAHRDEPSTATFQTAAPGAVRGEDIWDLSTIRMSVGGPQEAARELQERGKRAIELMVPANEGISKEDAQTKVERLQNKLDGERGHFSRHLLMTGSPVYKRAWLKRMSGQGVSGEAELRALNLTGEEGGYLLPYTLDPTIVDVSNGVRNPIRAISDVKQTTTNVWKGVTTAGGEAEYREAEGEETSDDSPKFKQPEITCHAADFFAQWTYEFGQDYGSIAGELATVVQNAKDVLEAEKFLSGTGEKEPFGVLTGAEEVVESAAEKAFSSADIYNVEEALGSNFSANGSFVANRSIWNLVRQFAENDGPELWVRMGDGFARRSDGALAQGILGYPTYELSTMESKVTQNKYILLFGDFSYYVIADRIGMFAKPVDNIPGEEGRPTGQSGLYFWWRNGAKVLSKAPFRKLKIK